MGALANSEDPDEMQRLHYLLKLKQLSETEMHHNLVTSTVIP